MGNDYWYLSPLHEEKNASFKINRSRQLWYDHSLGKGGGLVAFAKEYYHCDYKELLQKFREHLHISDNIPTEKVTNTESQKTATTDTHIDDRRIYITAERPIQAGFLKAYIHSRKIPFPIADRYCKEVEFTLKGKKFIALGFKNDAGGYELRNKNFKAGSSPSLVPAEANKQQQELWKLKPVAEKIIYRKIETKAAISNTVRAVTRDYTFTSLAELNAVLKGFNVTAYRGEEGSKMYEKKGLAYSVIDKKGNRTGVPIKASSIYSKPTLKNLERYFIENREKRKPYKQRLKGIIDKALHTGLQDRFALQYTLKKESIEVIFRENESMVYGITFIDHAAKTVFNGSDLGKDYTAKRILERLGESGRLERLYQKETEEKIGNILSDLDYSKGIQGTIKQLYEKGLSLDTIKEENNSASYFLSYTEDEKYHSISAGKKLSAYFQANGITNDHCEKLNEYVESNRTNLLQSYIEGLFAQQSIAPSGRITPDKKKHKRKVNW